MKFKVGDRVAVYHGMRTIGAVSKVHETGHVEVSDSGEGRTFNKAFHPKQCRLLKKKEQRRVWVLNEHLEKCTFEANPSNPMQYTEFIEVKKK